MSPEQNLSPEENNASSPLRILGIIFGIVFLLVGAFYGLLLWSLFAGTGVGGPIFQALGITGPNLKQVLVQFTNGIFGTLSLLLLIMALVSLFQWLLLGDEIELKKKALRKTLFWGFAFLLCAGSFIFMYVLIDRAAVGTTTDTDQSLILTNPDSVIALQAPITIDFDLETKLLEQFGTLENVRQVSWDFEGDGTIDANGPKVSHRYLDKGKENGQFLVKATVRYFSSGTGQVEVFETQREVVIDNVGVYADIQVNAAEGVTPFNVEFTGADSSDPDGTILKYEWDFNNDGVYDVTQEKPEIVQYTFSAIGEHTVKLRVTGSSNEYSVGEKVITVTGGRPTIEAKINSDSGFTGEVPFEVILSGKDSYVEEGVITKYEWFFQGEKGMVLGSTQKRVFREPGTYKVALTVENDLGERHRMERDIIVTQKTSPNQVIIATDPVSKMEDVLEGYVPFDVDFDTSSSSIKTPVDWAWDFNDDDTPDQFGQKISYTFRESGDFIVRVNIRDINGNEYKALKRVKVAPSGLRAQIAADKLSGDMPLSVAFDGSGSFIEKGEIIDYIWEFPYQEPIHYGAQIAFIFRRVGNFPVKLTIVDSFGNKASTQAYISVRPPSVIAEFKATPDNGASPLEVQFDASLSSGDIREYHWSFGDGLKSQEMSPKHTFTTPGTYTIKLEVINPQGIIATREKTITVTKP